MNLSHWEIAYDPHQSPGAHNHAEIVTQEGQHAWLRLNTETILNASPGEQREIFVHELCHLYTDRMRNSANHIFNALAEAMEKSPPTRAKRIAMSVLVDCCKNGFYEDEEYAVQGFARLLAPHLPLPPKLSDRK